ncbi:MAG TPA: hypothetical protein VNW97_22900 [Candidatus Saccharimonadales bacterium]|nr:hypothetical protein [Candidatus Saccharimonadales bacterium]
MDNAAKQSVMVFLRKLDDLEIELIALRTIFFTRQLYLEGNRPLDWKYELEDTKKHLREKHDANARIKHLEQSVLDAPDDPAAILSLLTGALRNIP